MKRFGFFNSINGDRKYLASDISKALDIATTTGIKQEEGVFEVTPYEDMTVKINPGSALIFGCFYSNDEDELIKLDMADGELNRIDRIAIRYDRFDRSVDTVVLKGTNALNPTPPTPLRNENQFDLVLADIYIRKAATEISTSDITDMRESELCGYIGVKGAVSQLEFDAHLAEFELYKNTGVKWERIDNLSAPAEIKGSSTADGTTIPLSQKLNSDSFYAIGFSPVTATDKRRLQFTIVGGNDASSGACIAGYHGGTIYTCAKAIYNDNLILFGVSGIGGTPSALFCMGVWLIK